MNGTIWKYPIEVTDDQAVDMPAGAQVLSVQVQGGAPCVWATVDPDAPVRPRRLRTFGTGHPDCDFSGVFVGTYQLRGGSLVFHLFDCGEMALAPGASRDQLLR